MTFVFIQFSKGSVSFLSDFSGGRFLFALSICVVLLSHNMLPHRRTKLCMVRRTGPCSRTGVSDAPRRAGTVVRNASDSDVIYYLSRTRLPVIGTESYSA